jgi:hypothetical protein
MQSHEPAVSPSAAIDVSFAEEQMWLADRAGPLAFPFVDCAPNVSVVVRLENALNYRALEASLTDVVSRHDVLRSRFPAIDGRPIKLCEPPSPLGVTYIDLRRSRAEERQDLVARELTPCVSRRFDLSTGPLLRAHVLALSDTEHILAITIHHIVFDRWSRRVLAQELGELYEAYSTGRTPALQPLRRRYGDYVHWQRRRLEGEQGGALIEYWTKRLHSAADLAMPCDGARDRVSTTRSASVWFTFPAPVVGRLSAASRQRRVPLATVVLTILTLFLHRVSGLDDITVGVPLSDRRHPDFEPLIGLFMNVVVVRTTITRGMTFAELLDRVRRALVEACRYQDLPYGCLLHTMRARRPLFRVLFNFMPDIPAGEMALAGLRVEPLSIAAEPESLADVSLHIRNVDGVLACRFVYKADLFSEASVQRFASQFQTLVTEAIDRPDNALASYGLR